MNFEYDEAALAETEKVWMERIEYMRQLPIVDSEHEINNLLVSRETSPLKTGTKLVELIRRPQLGYYDLAPFDKTRPALLD